VGTLSFTPGFWSFTNDAIWELMYFGRARGRLAPGVTGV
jgi:hypothetical protein